MSETNFFWDPLSDNILQERDETGAVTAEYTTEPGLYGNLISQNRGGVESQYHFDPQGSTLALTDDNENVTDTYAYNAFGEVTEHTGSTVNPFQYGGQKGVFKDEETGDYMVSRQTYSPTVGRWLNPAKWGSYVVGGDPLSILAAFAAGEGEPRNSSLYPFVPGIKITSASITPCVNAEFAVKFLIPPPEIVASGFVVQEIQATYDIMDCNGKDVTLEKMNGVRQYHYWEAFDIALIRFRNQVRDPDDTFEFARDLRGTRGTHKVTGVAKGAGNVPLPPIFEPNQPGIPAGTLPTTTIKPDGWDALPGTEHNMTVTWDCCCNPPCVLMHTIPSWAIDVSIGPGVKAECPIQIPSYEP